jgi:putative peptidoglycan lipid II flippase
MALLRSFATVGGYTGISRVLGFLRDILIADQLGTGPIADVFFVAFRLPNLFRRLFGEGAFNAAFVPLFARRLEQDGEAAAKAFGEQALAVLLTGLLGPCPGSCTCWHRDLPRTRRSSIWRSS